MIENKENGVPNLGQLFDELAEIEKRWRLGKRLCKNVIQLHMNQQRRSLNGRRVSFECIRDMLNDVQGQEWSGNQTPVAVTLNWITHRLLEMSSTPNFFELSEGIALRLAATELKGVLPEDMRLPYKAFCVILPQDFLSVYNEQTGWHRGSMIMVCEGDWGEEPGVVGGRRLVLGVYGEPNAESTHPQDDACITFSMPLTPGATLHDLISKIEYPGGHTFRGPDGTEFDWVSGVKYVIRFISNLCLYLSSPDPDVVREVAPQLKKLEGKKDKTSKERRKRLEQNRTYIVGGKAKLDPAERDALRSGDRHSVAYKSLVRGHWRQHAHGTGRQLRKTIWIKPHVRQKELNEVLRGKDYVVGA